MYAKIIHSAQEGPDGEDEWTRVSKPVGQANEAMEEFVAFWHKLSTFV